MPRPGTRMSSNVCQNSPVAQFTGWVVEQLVACSRPFGAPPCSDRVGPPAETIVAVRASSSEKYAEAPGASPPVNVTMPPWCRA